MFFLVLYLKDYNMSSIISELAVIPTRGSKPTYGTNPISLAAPANNNDSFVLDMATTTVALGKIELANRKGENMPDGWGADRKSSKKIFFKVKIL